MNNGKHPRNTYIYNYFIIGLFHHTQISYNEYIIRSLTLDKGVGFGQVTHLGQEGGLGAKYQHF